MHGVGVSAFVHRGSHLITSHHPLPLSFRDLLEAFLPLLVSTAGEPQFPARRHRRSRAIFPKRGTLLRSYALKHIVTCRFVCRKIHICDESNVIRESIANTLLAYFLEQFLNN